MDRTQRKSFIIHKDSLDVLEDLTDEQAGQLLKAMWSYQKKEAYDLSAIVKIAFNPFKHQFDRDDVKYENTCKRRAEAGAKGGKQKVANASNRKQKVAKVADNKSKSKNKSKNKSNISKDINTFVPNEASIEAANSIYPNCSIDDLVIDFIDQAANRKNPFKDLQSGFRNYVRKGWVKPKEQISKSFAQMATESESPWDENGRLIGLLDDGTFESDKLSNMRVL